MVAAVVANACALTASSAGALSLRALRNHAFTPQIINGQAASIEPTPSARLRRRRPPFERKAATSFTDLLLRRDPRHDTHPHCGAPRRRRGTTTPEPAEGVRDAWRATSYDYLSRPRCELAQRWPRRACRGARYSVALAPVGRRRRDHDARAATRLLAPPCGRSSLVVTAPPTPAHATPSALSARRKGRPKAEPSGNLSPDAHRVGSRTCWEASEPALRGAVDGHAACGAVLRSRRSSATCRGVHGSPISEELLLAARVCLRRPRVALVFPTGRSDVFTNVAAPRIHAFSKCYEAPPGRRAPTPSPRQALVGRACPPALARSPASRLAGCGSPTLTYTFQPSSAAAPALRRRARNVFAPPTSLLGTALVCAVRGEQRRRAPRLQRRKPRDRCRRSTHRRAHRAALPRAGVHAVASRRATPRARAHRHRRASPAGHGCVVTPSPATAKGRQPTCRATLTVALPVASPWRRAPTALGRRSAVRRAAHLHCRRRQRRRPALSWAVDARGPASTSRSVRAP